MEKQQLLDRPKRRWMRYVLVASLGMNILVLGLIGGAFIRGGPPGHDRVDREVTIIGLRTYYRALDIESQGQLRSDIATSRGQIKAGRAVFRTHLKALATALKAEPFSQEAVAKVLAEQATEVSMNIGVGHQLLLKQIAQMSVKDRTEMANRLLNPKRQSRR